MHINNAHSLNCLMTKDCYNIHMYTVKNFSNLKGLHGFSDSMINNHITLYEGYVKNTNIINDKLVSLSTAETVNTPEYNELKRRFGWEYNGMYLHELYFECLNKSKVDLDTTSELALSLIQNFGSYTKWEEEFLATGSLRGIGWAILVKTAQGDLKNIWVNEHDVGLLAGSTPIIVMDVFEHSYMIDYNLKRVDYIKAFFNVLDWSVVQSRFDK